MRNFLLTIFVAFSLQAGILLAAAPEKPMVMKADFNALKGIQFTQKQEIRVNSTKSVGKLVRKFNYKLTVNEQFEHSETILDDNSRLKSFERYYDKARRDCTENNQTTENEPCSFEMNFVRFKFTPEGVLAASDDEAMSKEDAGALAKEIHPEFLLPDKELAVGESWDFNNHSILAGFDLDPKMVLPEANSAKGTFKKLEGDVAVLELDLMFKAKPNEKSMLLYQLQMAGSIRYNTKTGIVEDFRYSGEYGMKSQGSEGPTIEHIISFSGERLKK